MKFKPSRRLLLLAIVAAVAAVWLGQGGSTLALDNLPPPAAPAAPEAPRASPPAGAPAELPRTPVDIFAVRTWMPAPPPVPVADLKPPPRPEAPPLPFRFLGKIAEPGAGVAFLLARGDRVLSVSVGEIINGTYLVEKYDAGRLYFIYKPLKARQSISVGRDS